MIELQSSIGAALVGIGEHRQAIEVLKDAARLAVSRLPDPHPRTAAVQLQLAVNAIDVGELALAETSLDAAEQGMRRLGDTAGLAEALVAKSELRRDRGEHEVALAVAKQALAAAEAYAARSGDQRQVIEA